VGAFLFLFSLVIFYAPTMGGYFLEYANFEPANPLQTPPHIAPCGTSRRSNAILRPCRASRSRAAHGRRGAAVRVSAMARPRQGESIR